MSRMFTQAELEALPEFDLIFSTEVGCECGRKIRIPKARHTEVHDAEPLLFWLNGVPYALVRSNGVYYKEQRNTSGY